MSPAEQLISEAIQPVAGTFDTVGMAIGEPGVPKLFDWRDQRYEVARVLSKWKTTGPCRHGGSERYVRKHWYTVVTMCGRVMKLYCDRQKRRGGKPKQRWWLYTLCESEIS